MFHIPILMFTWDVEVTLMGRSFWRDSNFFSSSVETSLIRPERAWGNTKSCFTLKRKDKESAPYGKDGITNLMMRNWMMSWWPRLGLSSFPILMRVDLDRRRLQVEHALAGILLNSLLVPHWSFYLAPWLCRRDLWVSFHFVSSSTRVFVWLSSSLEPSNNNPSIM